MNKILLVGGGGREDAICRKLVQSGAEVFSALGHENPDILKFSKKHVLLKETDYLSVVAFALDNSVDLAFVGPDPVLATPLVDELQKRKIRVASPSMNAARIETDKTFMRALLDRWKIAGNPLHSSFDNVEALVQGMRGFESEFVVKPIGLTGGKGVKVMGDHFTTREEGVTYAKELIQKDGRVLIEEKMVGEEFSLQVFCDGKNIAPMPLAQDYKRAYEGDLGPNTGGMGSITDANHLLPFIPPIMRNQALDILKQVVNSMRVDGYPFRGVMYGQFMVTGNGLKLIEINARFADPEGINVLFLMEENLTDVLFAIADGSLSEAVKFRKKATVLKYVVPVGYGSNPVPGELSIEPLIDKETGLFYASVSGTLSKVKMSSSRALAIIAEGGSIPEAGDKVDRCLASVKGNYYVRKDIGTQALLQRKIDRMNEK